MYNLSKFIVIGIVFFNFACSSSVEKEAPLAVANEAVENKPEVGDELTKNVVQHHLTAFGENNLEALMEDYTDESVVIAPDSMYVGLEQIKFLFTTMLPAFPTEGTTFSLDKMYVKNELAYILWHAQTPAVEVPLGSDTFIVEDGKIKCQTFAAVINPIGG